MWLENIRFRFYTFSTLHTEIWVHGNWVVATDFFVFTEKQFSKYQSCFFVANSDYYICCSY